MLSFSRPHTDRESLNGSSVHGHRHRRGIGPSRHALNRLGADGTTDEAGMSTEFASGTVSGVVSGTRRTDAAIMMGREQDWAIATDDAVDDEPTGFIAAHGPRAAQQAHQWLAGPSYKECLAQEKKLVPVVSRPQTPDGVP